MASARLHTLSTVKPYSRITTSPGAEAPKRSTPITSPRSADVAMPTLRHAGLDREPRADRRRQHRVAVLPRLGLEQLPARHRDDARLDALLQQLLPRRHDQRDFRAGGDQDQIGLAARRIGQDVGAAPQAVGRGELRAVERRHVLPRQHQRHRPVARLQRDAPGDGGLVGVARRMTMRLRNRAQAGELLDRLMRGAVLAQRDAVVGEHVDHVQPHQRGEADRRAHVIGEDQERRAERDRSRRARPGRSGSRPCACSRTPKCRLRPA